MKFFEERIASLADAHEAIEDVIADVHLVYTVWESTYGNISKLGEMFSFLVMQRIVDSSDISWLLSLVSGLSPEDIDQNVLAVIESLDQFEDELAKLLVQANRLAILDEAKRKKQEMKAVLLTED